MSNDAALAIDALELDAIKESFNIGMGRAAALLAEILEHRVLLQVPEVEQITDGQLGDRFRQPGDISLVRQPFSGQVVSGEVVALMRRDAYKALMQTYGYGPEERSELALQQEVLLEITATLAAATLSGVAEQLGGEIDFAAPALVCVEQWTSLHEALFSGRDLPWRQAVLVEIGFAIEAIDFSASLYVFIPESSLPALKRAIGAMLEGL